MSVSARRCGRTTGPSSSSVSFERPRPPSPTRSVRQRDRRTGGHRLARTVARGRVAPRTRRVPRTGGPGQPRQAVGPMKLFRTWATGRGLVPSETVYVARTRDRRPLRFSKTGNPDIERAYRTHWVSPELSDSEAPPVGERQSRPADLVVVSPVKDWTCAECSGTGDLLIMEGPGPLCLACADMDHLVYLPSGDAALTRRAKKASRLSAVVVRFSRRGALRAPRDPRRRGRSRPSRAGVPGRRRGPGASPGARGRARRADAGFRLRRRRWGRDRPTVPRLPRHTRQGVAHQAGARGSGRVGRSAAGRALDPRAVTLAVAASVRHEDTRYDELLIRRGFLELQREKVASRGSAHPGELAGARTVLSEHALAERTRDAAPQPSPSPTVGAMWSAPPWLGEPARDEDPAIAELSAIGRPTSSAGACSSRPGDGGQLPMRGGGRPARQRARYRDPPRRVPRHVGLYLRPVGPGHGQADRCVEGPGSSPVPTSTSWPNRSSAEEVVIEYPFLWACPRGLDLGSSDEGDTPLRGRRAHDDPDPTSPRAAAAPLGSRPGASERPGEVRRPVDSTSALRLATMKRRSRACWTPRMRWRRATAAGWCGAGCAAA